MEIGKLALGAFVGAIVVTAAAEASASEDLLRSCVTQLNANTIPAYRFPNTTSGSFIAPVSRDPTLETCMGYTWVYSEQGSIVFAAGPQWAGNVASYCPHSDIEYAVYGRATLHTWQYFGGGAALG